MNSKEVGTLIIMGVIGIPILSVLGLSLISQFSKSKWYCTFWGWHKSPNYQGFDGLSNTGCCSRCNKEVLQDSNGDWF